MQQSNLPSEGFKLLTMTVGKSVHALDIKVIGQGAGGLYKQATMVPGQLRGNVGQISASGGTCPVGSPAAAPICRAHFTYILHGHDSVHVQWCPLTKTVLLRQFNQFIHSVKAP